VGTYFLTDLAAVCRTTGYPVIEVGAGRNVMGPEWQHRSRRSGGYDAGRPNHIMCHHTASGSASDGWPDVNYMIFSPSNPNRPTANLYIARTANIYVMAAGASNTNGVGHDRCGMCPDNQMNTHALGIEAGNNGVGEPWPEIQQDCYVRLVQVLSAHYGIGHAQVEAHFEWTGRKIDPAGESSYATGRASWNMDAFRSDVTGAPPPTTTPPPVEPPTPSNWWDPLMQQMPILQQGAKGSAVKRMQHLLAASGHMNPANTSNYDGVFGSGTRGALDNFKQSAGGARDGICDPWTWGALMHTVDGIPTIKKGASGADVERMQHLLAAAGYMNEANTANYDGQWGNGTETAKTNFDRAHGLTPSPPTDCGQRSWTKLLGK
jgi:hypothetical protein